MASLWGCCVAVGLSSVAAPSTSAAVGAGAGAAPVAVSVILLWLQSGGPRHPIVTIAVLCGFRVIHYPGLFPSPPRVVRLCAVSSTLKDLSVGHGGWLYMLRWGAFSGRGVGGVFFFYV